MQVVDAAETSARVARRGETRRVSTLLLGAPLRAGDWVLVHVDAAIRRISAQEARLVEDALGAVVAAASGAPFEHLIADLVDREPTLPPHLRAAAAKKGDAS
jgi:hydrogenase expression/formation protein HypC